MRVTRLDGTDVFEIHATRNELGAISEGIHAIHESSVATAEHLDLDVLTERELQLEIARLEDMQAACECALGRAPRFTVVGE